MFIVLYYIYVINHEVLNLCLDMVLLCLVLVIECLNLPNCHCLVSVSNSILY